MSIEQWESERALYASLVQPAPEVPPRRRRLTSEVVHRIALKQGHGFWSDAAASEFAKAINQALEEG